MRILHITPTYIPAFRYGGPIYSVHGLCKALTKLANQVEVVTTSVNGSENSDVPHNQLVDVDGVKVRYFKSGLGRRLYYSSGMATYLKHNISQFDIVHNHSVFLWPTWYGARQAKNNNIPYIVSPRGMLVSDLIDQKSTLLKSLWINLIEKNNLKCARAIHATSKQEAEQLKIFNPHNTNSFVLPNGVDIPKPANLKRNRKNRSILYLGRINWKKGLDRLLESIALLPSARLIIAGNDEENYWRVLQKKMNALGIKDRVDYLGSVNADEKAQLFNNASMLVLSSYNENFGNVVLEAMSHKCPVVVTPEVGAAEVVAQAKAGIVESGEPALFAKAIDKLLKNEELQKQFANNGYEWVTKYYSWANIASEMVKQYKNLITNNK